MKILRKLDYIAPDERITVSRANPDDSCHAHDFYELVFVSEGTAEHVLADTAYTVGRGDLFLVDIGVEHCYRRPSADFEVLNCLFLPAFLSDVVRDDSTFSELAGKVFMGAACCPDKPLFVRAGGVPEARATMLQMYDEFHAKKAGYLEVIQALLKVLLIYVFRAPDTPAVPRSARLVDDIIEYVSRSGGRKVRVEEISQAMFFSPAYIGRIFKETTGIPLSRFIAEKRMEHVCRLLSDTDGTIESILAEAGYSDKKSFYEQFYKRYGCTPGEYRQRSGS